MKGLQDRVSAVLESKIESELRTRRRSVEEALQQKVHEFNFRNMLQSGGAYLSCRQVIEEEIKQRAASAWQIISTILTETGISLTEPLAEQVKARIAALLQDTLSELEPRLQKIAQVTGAREVEPLGNLIVEVISDIAADVDLATLRDARPDKVEVNDSFARMRDRLETRCSLLLPQALPKLRAIQQNLRSSNPEDWANAVHSCRRLLEELADSTFPPQDQPRVVDKGGKTTTIQLGKSNYINRLVAFVEDNSSSEHYTNIVGSHMSFFGDRLDAIATATQKGTHAEIRTRDEADRYVLYSIMLIADVLYLFEESRMRLGQSS